MDKPPASLGPFGRRLWHATVLLMALVFVGAVVLAFVTGRPLVAAYAAGACVAGIVYLLALGWMSRRM